MIKTTLPRISYFLFFSTLFYQKLYLNSQINLKFNGKLLFFLLNFLNPLLLIIGKNSIIIVLLFFIILRSYLKVVKFLNLGSNLHFYVMLSYLSIFLWLSLGHRCQVSALLIKSGYVGFEEFVHAISMPLVGINTFAS